MMRISKRLSKKKTACERSTQTSSSPERTLLRRERERRLIGRGGSWHDAGKLEHRFQNWMS